MQWMIFQLFAARMNHARIMVKESLGILLYAVITGKKRIADYCIAEPAGRDFQNVKERPCSMPGYRMTKLNLYQITFRRGAGSEKQPVLPGLIKIQL